MRASVSGTASKRDPPVGDVDGGQADAVDRDGVADRAVGVAVSGASTSSRSAAVAQPLTADSRDPTSRTIPVNTGR